MTDVRHYKNTSVGNGFRSRRTRSSKSPKERLGDLLEYKHVLQGYHTYSDFRNRLARAHKSQKRCACEMDSVKSQILSREMTLPKKRF